MQATSSFTDRPNNDGILYAWSTPMLQEQRRLRTPTYRP
jgi:hypothetical protein